MAHTEPTPRQVDILRLMAEGLTTSQIARRLFVSPKTIKSQRVSLYVRIGVPNASAAVAWAFRNGVLV